MVLLSLSCILVSKKIDRADVKTIRIVVNTDYLFRYFQARSKCSSSLNQIPAIPFGNEVQIQLLMETLPDPLTVSTVVSDHIENG